MNKNSAFAALGNLTASHQKEAYFGDAWNALKGGVKSTVDNTYNAAAKGMGQMKDDVYNAGAAGLQQAKQMGSQAVQGAQNMGRSAIAGAQNMGTQAVDGTLNAIDQNLSKPIYGALGAGYRAAAALPGAAQQAFQATKDFGNQAVQGAQNLGTQGLQAAGQMRDDAYNAGAAGVQQAKQMGQQGLQAAGQMRDDAYNAGAAGLQQAVQGAQNMGRSAIAGAQNMGTQAVDGTLNAIDQNLSKPIYGALGAGYRGAAAVGQGVQDMLQTGMQQHGGAGPWQKSGSAFEALGMEKAAIAGFIAKGLGAGGRKLVELGFRSGSVPAGFQGAAPNKIMSALGDASLSAGRGMGRAASKIDDTPWLKNTINTAGVTGVGAGAYGIGSGRGERRGIGKGLSEGITIGSRAAYRPDPGFLGRLGQLFTGTPDADMSALDAWLNENKDEVIKKILSRKP